MSTLNVNCTCSVMFSGVLHYMYIVPLNILAQGGIHNILRLHALSFPTLHIPILLIRISNIDLYIGPTFTIVSSAARKHFDPKASEHSGLSCSLFQSGNIRFRIQHSSSPRIRLARLFHWEFKKKEETHVSTFGLIET